MIKRPADHGLHVTYQLHSFILKSYLPQPNLPHYRYELFFVLPYCRYNLILFVKTRLLINTSFFWSKSLMYRMWVK